MTYPPQQPGPYGPPPGGYGQQPGQNPPPGGYPQQPGGYPQTGGQPLPPGGYPPQPGGYPPGAPQQPGGYPQTGGFPQQPGGYPPAGGFGQPGAYGQQPGGFPPGYPVGGGPRKNRTPIILAGVGVAVILIVVFVGGFAWPGFFTGGSTSSPTDVANSYVSAVKTHDTNAFDNLLCTKPTAQQRQEQQQAAPQATISAASLVGTPTISGNSATAQVSVTATLPAALGGKTTTQTETLNMLQQNGSWCINDNVFGQGGSGPSAPPTPTLPSGFPSVAPSGSGGSGFGNSDVPSIPNSGIPSSLPGNGSGG